MWWLKLLADRSMIELFDWNIETDMPVHTWKKILDDKSMFVKVGDRLIAKHQIKSIKPIKRLVWQSADELLKKFEQAWL